MSTVPHGPGRRRSAWLATAREFFWILALGVIAAYAFFLALGAFAPGDVLALTIVIGALAVVWLAHAALARQAGVQDPRLRHDRERRGF